MPRVLTAIILAASCGLVLLASTAQADPAEYAGASADGSKVFFTTTAKLVPGDTDNGFSDVYERFDDTAPGIETYVTREISTGPTGGNDAHAASFDGVSSDGERVFFSTAESLVAEDKDHSTDVYMRTGSGTTSLVSQGSSACAPVCGNGAAPATYVGSTPSGSKVFFVSTESLAEGDGGETADVYVRDLGAAPATTALVSRPDPTCTGCGSEAKVTFQGASADGTKVVFESTDKMAEGDTDGGEVDVYERDTVTGRTALASPAGTCTLSASECVPLFRGLSSDGTRIFLLTKARLEGLDHDDSQDLYEWSSATGTATLLSISGEAEKGEGSFDAVFAGASADGSKAFFATREKLTGADTDATSDLYERAGVTTTLVSSGTTEAVTLNRVSADGATVLFSSNEALGGGDTGGKLDVYSWSGGAPTLVSAGSPSFDSSFAGASQDAAKVFYTTSAQLSGADSDASPDIYEGPGTPALISTGPAGGNGPYAPHLAAVSSDGAHAFFTTDEHLTVDDNFKGEEDVYDRSAGATLLVSVANSDELQLGPQAPGLTGTDPASPGASTEPSLLGEAEPGSAIKIYSSPDCSGAPVALGTAAEAGPAPGSFRIPVTVAAGSTTTFHATATNGSGDSSGCSTQAVSYRQESAAPPPGGEGSGGGGGSGGSAGSGGGSTAAPTGSGGNSGGPPGGSEAGIKIGGIVYVTPITRVTFGPASKTRSRRPVFRFVDATEQPGTSFVCRVDRRAWKGCSSPFKSPHLKFGRHTFAVKGRSFAGQWEQKPVTRRFKVVGRRR
jgi:hypothetical protein